MYYFFDHTLRYSAVVTVTISCNLHFQTFPHDSHKCLFILKNWIGDTSEVVLDTPDILINDEDNNEIVEDEVEFPSDDFLEYDFKLKTLPATTYLDNNFPYSMVQVRVLLLLMAFFSLSKINISIHLLLNDF